VQSIPVPASPRVEPLEPQVKIRHGILKSAFRIRIRHRCAVLSCPAIRSTKLDPSTPLLTYYTVHLLGRPCWFHPAGLLRATSFLGTPERPRTEWNTRSTVVYIGPCLVSRKFCKIFQISRHIESLDTCIEY